MELAAEEIRKNLALVRENIEAACRKAGRNPSEVTLLAVSKKKPTADIRAGCASIPLTCTSTQNV